MILGLLVRTSLPVIATVGIILLFSHNITDYLTLPQQGVSGILWKLLLTTKVEAMQIGQDRVAFAVYAILPWTAIMLLGYAVGYLYKKGFPENRRRKLLLQMGAGAIVLFLFLRLLNQYGDPGHWSFQKNIAYTILSLLNVTKYPVSLQYTCMTIGPLLVLLATLKGRQNRVTNFLMVFGKVPFFYYVQHFFLIHAITAILFFATGHTWSETNDPASFIFFRPASWGFSLGTVYLIWALVITILYFPCRWFTKYKASHKQWWLSYV